MTEDLRQRIEQARAALAALPDGALIGSLPPGCRDVPTELRGLTDLIEFLRHTDGPQCGEFVFFRASEDGRLEIGWLPGGVEVWLHVGWACGGPLVLNRRSHEVWQLDPESGTELTRRFRSLDELLLGVFGAKCLELSDDYEDGWCRLIGALGLA